jgi:hypothetical protein
MMRDEKTPAQRNEQEKGANERRAEATSNETLSDLERTEKVGASDDSSEEFPAPDAEPGEPRQKRDDAGPM